eukprot:m.57546 g.57546  ORF g.57546 m.57546 type:complete len:215 (-) comp11237_c0_seq2:1426-2070(-)
MSLIGQKCPEITGLQMLKGESPVVPSPSNVTVVEVWASWCGPCRSVFPHLSQIYDKNKSKGLVVVGVTQEPFAPKLMSFVSMQPMSYPVACDGGSQVQNKLMRPGGARGIPTAFLVDKNGIIRWQGHPADPKFESTISQLMAEAPSQQNEETKTDKTAEKVDVSKIEPLDHDEEVLKSSSIKQLKREMLRLGLKNDHFVEKSEFVAAILNHSSS